jgi:hypothetical protein
MSRRSHILVELNRLATSLVSTVQPRRGEHVQPSTPNSECHQLPDAKDLAAMRKDMHACMMVVDDEYSLNPCECNLCAWQR